MKIYNILIFAFLINVGCESLPASISESLTENGATVTWDANTESDLSGYKVYYGTSSGNYFDVIDVGNTTSFLINGLLIETTYFFAVTAFDFSGNESEFSDEVSFTIRGNQVTDNSPPSIWKIVFGDRNDG